jgi:hypothetical protein
VIISGADIPRSQHTSGSSLILPGPNRIWVGWCQSTLVSARVIFGLKRAVIRILLYLNSNPIPLQIIAEKINDCNGKQAAKKSTQGDEIAISLKIRGKELIL